MGIRGLFKLLQEKCQLGYYPQVPISTFAKTRMAVDATGWACILMAAIQSGVVDRTKLTEEALDTNEVFRRWAQLIIDTISHWLEMGVTPLFIFDGVARVEKEVLRLERVYGRLEVIKNIRNTHEHISKMEDGDEIEAAGKKLATMYKASWRLGKEHLDFLRQLIQALGLPFLEAKHDAEQLGALLVRDGYCNVLYSADSDALPFCCTLQIREIKEKMYDTQGRRVSACQVVNLQECLAGLQLSYQQFVDMCILGGCDYNESIPGIAVKTAYNIIRDFGSLERLPRMPPPQLLYKTNSAELLAILVSAGYQANFLLDLYAKQGDAVTSACGPFHKFPEMLRELQLKDVVSVEIYWTGVDGYSLTTCLFGVSGFPPRKGMYLNPLHVKRLPKTGIYDLALLNYEKCREIFMPSHSLDNCTAGKQTCTEFSFDKLLQVVATYNLDPSLQNLNRVRSVFTPV